MIAREPGRVGGWAGWRAAITQRWPVKLAALALALVLWFVVRAEQPTEVVLEARFVALVDSTLVLASGAPKSVQVVVTGRAREVLKLYANPPVVVRRFDDETRRNAPVRVTLSPADVDFPTGVEARARDVRPRVIVLTFTSPDTLPRRP